MILSKTPCRLALLLSAALAGPLSAQPAIDLLGEYNFPNAINGMPQRLSEFAGLEINEFTTNDGLTLRYWEAGSGAPIVFVPAWGAGGAEMIHQLWLLSQTHHVYVLDQRNQGTSERSEKGQRISRYAMDLQQFLDHIGVEKTALVGWSMGVSVIWNYIDLFGSARISKAAFVDEPVSIYTHADWTEEERRAAGGMTTSVERMIAAFQGAPTNQQVVDMKVVARAQMMEAPEAQNAMGLAGHVAQKIGADPKFTMQVMFDHATNDWRDVVRHKLDMPVAVFSGEESNNLPSQEWIAQTAPEGRLYSYTTQEQGDHFLMQKNPVKFSADLRAFLTE